MSVASVAARIARRICDVEDVGYSQPDRRTWYSVADWEGHVKSPQNADCSSLVCGAVNYGLHDALGVPWGHKALLEIDDFWTGNMRGGLEARGTSSSSPTPPTICSVKPGSPRTTALTAT